MIEGAQVVYFIRALPDGPVKIGTSRQMAARLDGLQAHSHTPLAVLRVVSGGLRTEKWFHAKFAEQRLHREWFTYHPDMLAAVAPTEACLLADEIAQAPARTYVSVVITYLRRRYLPLKKAAVMLAADAGSTPRTAENWLCGSCAPNGENLLNLMASNPGLSEEIMALVHERRRAKSAENY